MGDLTKVLLAIVSLGMLATVVVNGNNTAKVITAGGKAFSGSLTAAEKG